MKKLIFLLLFIVCAGTLHAQSYNAKIKGLDTLTNTAADTVSISIRSARATVAFQVNETKISGTVGGSVTVYGSMDNGAHYAIIATDTLTNASHVFTYSYNYNPYTKYQVIVSATGTQSSSYSIWALYR